MHEEGIRDPTVCFCEDWTWKKSPQQTECTGGGEAVDPQVALKQCKRSVCTKNKSALLGGSPNLKTSTTIRSRCFGFSLLPDLPQNGLIIYINVNYYLCCTISRSWLTFARDRKVSMVRSVNIQAEKEATAAFPVSCSAKLTSSYSGYPHVSSRTLRTWCTSF